MEKLYVISFDSARNVIHTKRIAVNAKSPDRALDAFWCWARLQPWYMHTWDLKISLEEILQIDLPVGPIKLT